MQYKNGREAKAGDKVVGRDCSGWPVSGYLIEMTPQSNSCNGRVIPAQTNSAYVTLSELLHVDDAFPKEEKK
jgi:hypothetical protein